MAGARSMTLREYLGLEYPFNAIADPDGGYVIRFPDLPGCLTQVESMAESGEAARGAFEAWMEAAYEGDLEIPLPSYPPEYSGRFNVRLPGWLHGELVREAAAEGISLNSWVMVLLAKGNAEVRTRKMAAGARTSASRRRERKWSFPRRAEVPLGVLEDDLKAA